jgi:C4-dicarboxylate-specific signal transduction histidine kinase
MTAAQAEAPALAPDFLDPGELRQRVRALEDEVGALQARVKRGEDRRRAMIHIMDDLSATNRRLSDQRRAMLHILVDYERDRRRLARQTERLDNSRRALLHILQDSHESNLRLERSRKAMIHIMGDLRERTEEIQLREQELREKQEQLIQAGKLATLGELTTGVAHELNNPLNNIGLYLGNMADHVRLGELDADDILEDVEKAQRQVGKASEIISHLRTFGRAAVTSREPVLLRDVILSALSLLQEQLRLRQITVELALPDPGPSVSGNAIQLEQVLVNLLTNARDATAEASNREIGVAVERRKDHVAILVRDSGPGIPPGLESRIFDPFVTTKDVGLGTGLGLSIAYGIVKDHDGEILVANVPGSGAEFTVVLPVAAPEAPPADG